MEVLIQDSRIQYYLRKGERFMEIILLADINSDINYNHKIYADNTGTVIAIKEFCEEKEFYSSGLLSHISKIRNIKKQGSKGSEARIFFVESKQGLEKRFYDKSKVLYCTTEYYNNKRNGKQRGYYISGIIEWESFFKEGTKCGKEMFFGEKAFLSREDDNDHTSSIYSTYYYTTGIVESITTEMLCHYRYGINGVPKNN